jgi:HK97 family phage major capsid protein
METMELPVVLGSVGIGAVRNAADLVYRDAMLLRDGIDIEKRTVRLSFSSELPYERYWGVETLSHDSSAVNLARLRGGAHPLLMDHDSRDQIGKVNDAWIGTTKKGEAEVRFGKSPRAEEIFQDVVDGIRSLVSVGYWIHDMQLTKSGDEGDEWTVTNWEPMEISIVSIPADPSVGVGRGAEQAHVRSLIDLRKPQIKEIPVDVKDKTETNGLDIKVIDVEKERSSASAAERQRNRDIRTLGEKFNKRAEAEAAIDSGEAYEAFREKVFGDLEKSGTLRLAESTDIGLTKKETQQFRFTKLIAATMFPDDASVRKIAGFEIECARAAADKREDVRTDRSGAFTIPSDVLSAPLAMNQMDAARAVELMVARYGAQQRDLLVGTPTAGGNLVATNLLGSSFIELLVNQMSVTQMGATMITDLSGNVAIPRQTSGSIGYWVGENLAPTESQAAFDQVAMTPKTIGAFSDYSRRLLLQSSITVESFVRMDIARTIGLGIDYGALWGPGTANNVRGVGNTVGIGSVAGGVNGLAPNWDLIVALETAVEVANARFGSLGYLTNGKVRGKLKTTQQFTGTNGVPIWQNDQINGYKAVTSQQVPSNLTKGTSTGVCSAILFGNWADLIIGMWGGLDILIDPYSQSTSGTKRVVALQDVDVAVRQLGSFASMQDALTA